DRHHDLRLAVAGVRHLDRCAGGGDGHVTRGGGVRGRGKTERPRGRPGDILPGRAGRRPGGGAPAAGGWPPAQGGTPPGRGCEAGELEPRQLEARRLVRAGYDDGHIDKVTCPSSLVYMLRLMTEPDLGILLALAYQEFVTELRQDLGERGFGDLAPS